MEGEKVQQSTDPYGLVVHPCTASNACPIVSDNLTAAIRPTSAVIPVPRLKLHPHERAT